jgi:hypothetical protein
VPEQSPHTRSVVLVGPVTIASSVSHVETGRHTAADVVVGAVAWYVNGSWHAAGCGAHTRSDVGVALAQVKCGGDSELHCGESVTHTASSTRVAGSSMNWPDIEVAVVQHVDTAVQVRSVNLVGATVSYVCPSVHGVMGIHVAVAPDTL